VILIVGQTAAFLTARARLLSLHDDTIATRAARLAELSGSRNPETPIDIPEGDRFEIRDERNAIIDSGVGKSKQPRISVLQAGFETDAKGNERLTADGQARLDSAMSQFVRYPRNSPFVVEGYAAGSTNDERFLASRRRCQLVRDYLVAKFALDPAFVASMPMGQESSDSPDGNRWDGVALTLFVPTSAM